MWSAAEIAEFLRELAAAALSADDAVRGQGEQRLLGCSGGVWLGLDDRARGGEVRAAVLTGLSGWPSPRVEDASGFTAAVAAMHPDGRVRQRATRLLADGRGRLRAGALAVRCLDHVPEVRADALAGLVGLILPAEADLVVGVLTAAAGRSAAPAAMTRYTEVLLTDPAAADTIRVLRTSGDRGVRRWAWTTSLTHGLLDAVEIAAAAAGEPDQLIRARCVESLARHASPEVVAGLLDGRFVDGRVAAVQHLPDGWLPDDRLKQALLDGSVQVRELAQWRMRRRGLDPAAVYRARLGRGSARDVAACLAGIAAVGSPADRDLVGGYLDDDRARVRAAAVGALTVTAVPAVQLDRLPALLLDPSPRVATAAAKALSRAGATPAVAAGAWASEQVWSRRAAWRIQRATGGWHRLEADLRARADPDGALVDLGRTAVLNWLEYAAASTWSPPPPTQRQLIGDRLTASPFDAAIRRELAFHAGLPFDDPRTRPLRAVTPAPPGRTARASATASPAPGTTPDRPGAATSDR